jgi:amidase
MSEGDSIHNGMRLFRESRIIAPYDTYLAAKFKAAGLICIGKTNTPELGLNVTTEPEVYGPSRNPWDLSRSTGGSSGGSAAAVASRLVAVAHARVTPSAEDGDEELRGPVLRHQSFTRIHNI